MAGDLLRNRQVEVVVTIQVSRDDVQVFLTHASELRISVKRSITVTEQKAERFLFPAIDHKVEILVLIEISDDDIVGDTSSHRVVVVVNEGRVGHTEFDTDAVTNSKSSIQKPVLVKISKAKTLDI